jgi:hypothetical protein
MKTVSYLMGKKWKYATCYFTRYVPQACHFHWYTLISESSSAATLATVKQAAYVPDCVFFLLSPSFSDASPHKKKSKGHKSGGLGGHSCDPLPIQWPGTCWPKHSHAGTAWPSITLSFQVNVTHCINVYTLCWNTNFILVMALLKKLWAELAQSV